MNARRRLALVPLLVLAACSDDEGAPDGSPGDDAGIDASSDAGNDTSGADSGMPDTMEPDTFVEPIEWCEGATSQIYNTPNSDTVDLWPDAYFERTDDESPTGIRLHVSDHPFVETLEAPLQPVATTIDAVSGFGTQSAIYARFDGAVSGIPQGAQASLDSEVAILVDLDADPVERLPYETEFIEEGRTPILRPVRPMEPGHRHAFIFTTQLVGEDGACVAPAQTTRDVFEGNAGDEFEEIRAQWVAAVDAVDLEPADVSAITTFVIHNDQMMFAEIADEIDQSTYEWTVREACVFEEDRNWERCELFFESTDYRDGRAVLTTESQGTFDVPVRAWFPVDYDGTVFPVVVGHGANGSKSMGRDVAEYLVPLGFAVIAADALEHGEHPVQAEGGEDFVSFLGLNLSPLALDGYALRGNFNQSVLDWVQLLQLVSQDGDVDGDGEDDFDTSRIGYLGLSMGSLLGSGVLALTNDVEASLLAIGGGRLIVFVTDIEEIEGFRPVIELLAGGPDELDRLLVLGQSAVDPADPATWGRYVFRDRLIGEAPHTVFPVTIHDEIVPFRAGQALAHSFDIPHVGPVFREVPFLEQQESPTAGNRDGLTVGYVQFDQVTRNGDVRPSDHDDMPKSDEGRAMIEHWFSTWRDQGTPEIITPQPGDVGGEDD